MTQRWLILPDSHVPYHDVRALEELIIGKVIPAFDWHGIVILGDWFDNYSISQYTKNPKRVDDLEEELAKGFELLSLLETFSFQRRVFVLGNHEDRLKRFLSEKAPQLYKFVTKAWEAKFERWEYVPYQEDIEIGKLFVTHDVGHAGAMSTRQTLHAYQDNVIIGHNHNMLYVVEGSAKGHPHVGASFGWLGDVDKIDYRHKMKARKEWVKGFGILHHDPRTDYIYIQPVPIVDYSCVVEGKLFKV